MLVYVPHSKLSTTEQATSELTASLSIGEDTSLQDPALDSFSWFSSDEYYLENGQDHFCPASSDLPCIIHAL
jgi:hypothetical protein